MMNFPINMRDRRNIFGPTHYSIANYCTETRNNMKPTFGEEYFLDNLHLIPDSLKRDLAETIIAEEKMPPKIEYNHSIDMKSNETNDHSRLAGITSFFSGVLNVLSSAMFSKRKQTDFGSENGGQMALPRGWHGAKLDDENKILQDEELVNDVSGPITAAEMGDCRSAVVNCQNKLEQVRLLLSKPVPCNVRVRRRPKKYFVEASSVEDSFEDAFAPEDFENLSNDSFLEYVTPSCNCDDYFPEIAASKIKTEPAKLEATDIVKNVPESVTVSENLTESVSSNKSEELVSSCEDKLSKLKALLGQRKKSKVTELVPKIEPPKEQPKQVRTVSKIKDKHYKNPNRCTDKRRSSKMRQNIQEDALFADEVAVDDLSSAENSPTTKNLRIPIPNTMELDYFDEISGRFHSTSATDSEDSFQIVFADSPRLRRPSDCESEDSYIIFEDSPDSCYVSHDCYTSNDAFVESSDSECDSDSEQSDSGCGSIPTFKLSHSLSKSVSNLTDDSLYVNASEDEVDCSRVDVTIFEKVTEDINSGLLIDGRKREIKKSLPPKKVQFSSQPPKVHVMRVWAFAARQARAGHWERYALDRERFKRRIADVDVAVSWVLRPQHRSRVMFQRFMPWWNAEKRKELAEKKQQAEEKLKKEAEERIKLAAEEVRHNEEDINLVSLVDVSLSQGAINSSTGPEVEKEELSPNDNTTDVSSQGTHHFGNEEIIKTTGTTYNDLSSDSEKPNTISDTCQIITSSNQSVSLNNEEGNEERRNHNGYFSNADKTCVGDAVGEIENTFEETDNQYSSRQLKETNLNKKLNSQVGGI